MPWESKDQGIKVKFMQFSDKNISTKECCRIQPGSNLQPPDHQSDVHPTEPPRLVCLVVQDSFYSNVVKCCPIMQTTQVWFLTE